MVYLDTDVLINFLVEQNVSKHTQADEIYREVTRREELFISFLVLQETAFVLGKLNVSVEEINLKLSGFIILNPYSYNLKNYKRAFLFAEKIGFQNFNDCLHTAIAEEHCNELITYNKSDFTKLQSLTSLKITIL